MAPISPTRKAAFAQSDDNVRADAVQRIGAALEHDGDSERPSASRSTDPFPHPADPRLRHDTRADGSEDGSFEHEPPKAANPRRAHQPLSRPGERSWGEVRPHYDHQYQYEDLPPRWLAWLTSTASRMPRAGWLVAGVLAILLLAFLVLPDAADDLVLEDDELLEEQLSEPASGPAPHIVTPAPLPGSSAAATPAAAGPTTATPPAQPLPTPTRAAIERSTEIVTIPAAAELVLAGAVVANTPARVPREDHDVDYLVRLAGYDSQLVRIGPQSPERISLQLTKAPADDSHSRPAPERASAPEATPTPESR